MVYGTKNLSLVGLLFPLAFVATLLSNGAVGFRPVFTKLQFPFQQSQQVNSAGCSNEPFLCNDCNTTFVADSSNCKNTAPEEAQCTGLNAKACQDECTAEQTEALVPAGSSAGTDTKDVQKRCCCGCCCCRPCCCCCRPCCCCCRPCCCCCKPCCCCCCRPCCCCCRPCCCCPCCCCGGRKHRSRRSIGGAGAPCNCNSSVCQFTPRVLCKTIVKSDTIGMVGACETCATGISADQPLLPPSLPNPLRVRRQQMGPPISQGQDVSDASLGDE